MFNYPQYSPSVSDYTAMLNYLCSSPGVCDYRILAYNQSFIAEGGILLVTPPQAQDGLQGSNLLYNMADEHTITLTLESTLTENVTIVDVGLWVFRADAIKVEPLDQNGDVITQHVRTVVHIVMRHCMMNAP